MTNASDAIPPTFRQTEIKHGAAPDRLTEGGRLAPDVKTKSLKVKATNGVKRESAEDPTSISDPGRSDSEAETVVPAGKGNSVSPEKRKSIEYKKNGYDAAKVKRGTDVDFPRVASLGDGTRKVSLKRKRTEPFSSNRNVSPEGANSSLSSRYSSPVHGTTSSKRSAANSERSRSSPPYDDASLDKSSKPIKRRQQLTESVVAKPRSKGTMDEDNARRPKYRDVRSATHDEFSTKRSESPQLPQQTRAQSSHADVQGTVKRKKPSLAVNVERRRKVSEDPGAFSDDTKSARNLPALRTASSIDQSMMPNRQPHKKNRDKSGRTLLAKACNGDIDEVRALIRDRPEDIDTADYAGNTPLQIASLAGYDDIVQLLIDAGCDIHCKNVDSDTPLIDAVENGHLDVVKVLLDAGADPRQGNKVGAEPLELLGEHQDDYGAIRDALLAAKKNDSRRRQSQDQGNRAHDDNSTSAGSPTDQTPMSALPGDTLGRRRTARSQPTRGDTLYTHATPEALRKAAAQGDAEVVHQILEMGVRADTETMIAATKGGHDEVLELLIAMGRPEGDPDPVHLGTVHEAQSTPVLAAIGRRNFKILELLICQPGFNPARRLFKGKTYHDLAEERQGVNWQQERGLLRKAYEQWQGPRANSVHDSPRKLKRRKVVDVSSSPAPSDKVESTQKDEPLIPIKFKSDKSHPQRLGDNDNSKHASDPESAHDKSQANTLKKSRSTVDTDTVRQSSPQAEPNKVRRRLMTKNEIESSQEQRRVSSAAETPTTVEKDRLRNSLEIKERKEQLLRKYSVGTKDIMAKSRRKDLSYAKDPTKKAGPELAETQDVSANNHAPSSPKKRSRLSDSPSHTKSADPVQKKRRRTDSQTSTDASSRPAAPMIPISSTSAVIATSNAENQPKTAPTAFMSASPTTSKATVVSPASQRENYRQDLQYQRKEDEATLHRERVQEGKEILTNAEKKEEANPFATAHSKPSTEQEKDIQATKANVAEEAALAAVKEAAQKDAERQAMLADEQLQRERVEREAQEKERLHKAEQKRNKEKERAAAEQVERQRRLQQEELEAKRKQEAEEEAQRLAHERAQEEERQRQLAEQKMLEAQLEQERQHQIAEAAAAERRRLEILPASFLCAADMPFAERTSLREMTCLLPLKAGKMRHMYVDCAEEGAEELWISNVQAALLLGTSDLELRDCKYPSQLPACYHLHC